MPGEQPNYLNQLAEIWARIEWRQRLTIILFTLLGLALIGSVVFLMNRVEYQAIYHDLNPEDAHAVATRLKEENLDFTVRGTTILVAAPKSEIDKLRLEISGSGLIRSGRIGYELFDKRQFGMTDFAEQINLQRALEGELARTISSLAEIIDARVHIVLPKESYFLETRESAKASVVLNLRRGSELSKSSITGIKGVVAGAVPGLRTQNVSIVDNEGQMLSQSFETADEAKNAMESGLREQLEREMTGKVTAILEPLVGRGRVHAKSSIDIDFTSAEEREESFNPDSAVVLSRQRTEERTGGGMDAAGIPGITSNLEPDSAQYRASSSERYRHSETTNYEVNKLVRHTIQPKGGVRRLSVAVILDHKTVSGRKDDGSVVTSREPHSERELNSYRELVLAAVGYNEGRGDVVTIENVPFYSELKTDEAPAAAPWYLQVRENEYAFTAIKYGAFILLFLLVYLIFIRPLRKKVFHAIATATSLPAPGDTAKLKGEKAARALSEGERPAEKTIYEGGLQPRLNAGEPALTEDILSLETASDEQIERELMREANSADMGNRKYVAIRKKLTEKAKKDPEMISQLIRSLLRENA
ncbi:MAG TPA: flagellar basal-body MS-ring/collar protein FliF [Acidobacteriota bacterium]|nr:flagellar basal-body MS-ring/collar protein FliF [Acidobacteriota bacterium]